MRVSAPLVLIAVLGTLPTSSLALERSIARVDTDDGWNRVGECSAQYFNECVGWSWVWSGWEPGDRASVSYTLGICSDTSPYIGDVYMKFRGDIPPGYGYTGTVSVHEVDADGCPVEPPVAEVPLLPADGWNGVHVGVTISRAIVSFTAGPGGLPSDCKMDSDFTYHPGLPIACGECFSPYRPPHSYLRDVWDEETCLGTTLEAGGCFSEWKWRLTGAARALGNDGPVPVTMETNGAGSIAPGTAFYPWNQPLTITAVPDSGYGFWRWIGAGSGAYNGTANPVTIVPADSVWQFAEFTAIVGVVIDLEPGDHLVVADGVSYETPVTIPWSLYGHHTIAAEELPPQNGPTRKRFDRWSDGVANLIRGYDVDPDALTLTGYYRLEHLLAWVANGPGSVELPDNWIGDGESVEVTAVPEYAYVLDHWEGDGEGSYTGTDNPATITMNGPITQTAFFVDSPTGVTLTLSASGSDPFVNAAEPAQFLRDVYLWVACADLGVSSIEAHVTGSMPVFSFTTPPGIQNEGSATDLVLRLTDCLTPGQTPVRVGYFTVLDQGGTLCLGSGGDLFLGTSDCNPAGSVVHPQPEVVGFATDGSSPCVVSGDGCASASPVGVSVATVPQSLSFEPVSPNPARSAADFAFQLDRDVDVSLEVFDVRGRRVTRLGASRYPVGFHRVRWDLHASDGAPVSAGVYFARFRAGEITTVRKFAVVRP